MFFLKALLVLHTIISRPPLLIHNFLNLGDLIHQESLKFHLDQQAEPKEGGVAEITRAHPIDRSSLSVGI